MNSKDNYNMQDLIALSRIVLKKNENKNIEEKENEKLKLSDEDGKLYNQFEESLVNIAELSDKEIKKIYKELKTKFYVEESERRFGNKYNSTFKSYENACKGMIKSDKNRNKLIHLQKAKFISVISLFYTGLYLIKVRELGFNMQIAPDIISIIEGSQKISSLVDYNQNLILANLSDFVESGQVEIVGGAFAIGLLLYATGKGLVKLDDVKTLRRLMVQTMAENISPAEFNAIIHKIRNGGSVKEAMNTYPLKDYGKSVDVTENDIKQTANKQDDGREL